MSVSRLDGEHLLSLSTRGEPGRVATHARREAGGGDGGGRRMETTLSCVVSKKLLLLARAGSLDAPVTALPPGGLMELAFQEKYGNIVSHEWFGDGYLLMGFSLGGGVGGGAPFGRPFPHGYPPPFLLNALSVPWPSLDTAAPLPLPPPPSPPPFQGHVVVESTHKREVAEEVSSLQALPKVRGGGGHGGSGEREAAAWACAARHWGAVPLASCGGCGH